MLKLYNFSNGKKEYWETWDNDNDSHTIHWGVLGTKGNDKLIKSSLFKNVNDKIQKEIEIQLKKGFKEIALEEHFTLLIEYSVNGMGTSDDIDKRYRLDERMNDTLGWTGLGNCDGGSIGTGTMEVCNYVVDFEVAKKVIENDLKDTEFSNYTRIFDENE